MAPPRPRWETNKKQPPPKVQKNPKAQKTKIVEELSAPSIPLEIQQLLLNIFRDSFAERFAENIKPLLQEVKGHLYNRDFATAFGKDEYLETYAARWSASRALGYAEVFWDLRRYLWKRDVNYDVSESDQDGTGDDKTHKIVCIGGGAGAEVVALAGVRKLAANSTEIESSHTSIKMDVTALDIADWARIVDQLIKHALRAPPLSKYASTAKQAANVPMVSSDSFSVTFSQKDVLESDASALNNTLKGVDLVTLMFTLNELYSTSLSLTQNFLLSLTSTLSKGALLLVVDSPGSYSTITLNGAEKKYPMQWLLDHTLLNQASGTAKEIKEEESKWEKVHEDESRWFRLDPALLYPIDLENMRMQLHLYRRV